MQELLAMANQTTTAGEHKLPDEACEVAGVNDWLQNGKEFFDVHSDALAVTPRIANCMLLITYYHS